jgi:hypothetical protein
MPGPSLKILRNTPSPACSRRREAASSGPSITARCASAARPTRSTAALPVGVTSIITTRRSCGGAERRTHPRCTIALMEFDIVGRLTPCRFASSLKVRGCALSIVSRPKCAGAGNSPAARSSAATVRITSGIILRISRATSREGRFIIGTWNQHLLVYLIVIRAKLWWGREMPLRDETAFSPSCSGTSLP